MRLAGASATIAVCQGRYPSLAVSRHQPPELPLRDPQQFCCPLGMDFPAFVINDHLHFVLFFHRQCHLCVHGVTFSLNSQGVSISLNNNT